jgi:hypothetical protein
MAGAHEHFYLASGSIELLAGSHELLFDGLAPRLYTSVLSSELLIPTFELLALSPKLIS